MAFVSKAVSRIKTSMAQPPICLAYQMEVSPTCTIRMEFFSSKILVAGTIYHQRHRARRHAIADLFSKRNLQNAEPIIRGCVEKILQRVDMQIQRDGYAEMRLNFFAMTTTIVDDYCVGVGVNLLDEGNEGKAKEWFEAISAVTGKAPLARQWSWITPLALKAPLNLIRALSHGLGRIVEWHLVRYPFEKS